MRAFPPAPRSRAYSENPSSRATRQLFRWPRLPMVLAVAPAVADWKSRPPAARAAEAAEEWERFRWAFSKLARRELASSQWGTRRSCLARCCWARRWACSSHGGREGSGKQCHPERSQPFALRMAGGVEGPLASCVVLRAKELLY